jgi:hypothetical protein
MVNHLARFVHGGWPGRESSKDQISSGQGPIGYWFDPRDRGIAETDRAAGSVEVQSFVAVSGGCKADSAGQGAGETIAGGVVDGAWSANRAAFCHLADHALGIDEAFQRLTSLEWKWDRAAFVQPTSASHFTSA